MLAIISIPWLGHIFGSAAWRGKRWIFDEELKHTSPAQETHVKKEQSRLPMLCPGFQCAPYDVIMLLDLLKCLKATL
jgi:hypothetical protein